MTTKGHRDLIMIIAERDNFTCQYCGKYIGLTGCLADRISQSKVNRRKYGNCIIDNPFNKIYTCIDNKCNDSFNVGFNHGKSAKLLSLIFTRGDDKLTAKQISEFLNA